MNAQDRAQNAARQAKYRLNHPREKKERAKHYDVSYSAKNTRCPICFETLEQRNISRTHAVKGCRHCRRKFSYVRTDTVDGRKLAAILRQRKYQERLKQEVPCSFES